MNDGIVLIPLDSRPANTRLPKQIAGLAGIPLNFPPIETLGDLYAPADRRRIDEWLFKSLGNGVDALVVSIDLLAYGGLVSSRKPEVSFKEALNNLKILRKIRRRFGDLPIFAFNIILRDAITITDAATFEAWKLQMNGAGAANNGVSPARRRNFEINMEMVRWAGENIFDCLIIGKEDTAEGNPNAAEFAALKREAGKYGGGRVSIQTGTDELASLLVARSINDLMHHRPAFYIDASEKDLEIVPRYEPAKIGDTLRAQIKSVGGRLVKNAEKAGAVIVPKLAENQKDLFLEQLNGAKLKEATVSAAWLKNIEKHIEKGRAVGIVDAIHLNGSSPALVKALLKSKLYFRLGGYAGWNTTANSSGTVIAQAAVAAAVRRSMGRKGGLEADAIAYAMAQFELLLNAVANDYLFSTGPRAEMAVAIDTPMSFKHPAEARTALKQGMELEFGKFAKKYLIGKTIEVYGLQGWALEATGGRMAETYFPWNRLFEAVTIPEIDLNVYATGSGEDD
ncbi:MAG: DUF4127 family protein [bacterium]